MFVSNPCAEEAHVARRSISHEYSKLANLGCRVQAASGDGVSTQGIHTGFWMLYVPIATSNMRQSLGRMAHEPWCKLDVQLSQLR